MGSIPLLRAAPGLKMSACTAYRIETSTSPAGSFASLYNGTSVSSTASTNTLINYNGTPPQPASARSYDSKRSTVLKRQHRRGPRVQQRGSRLQPKRRWRATSTPSTSSSSPLPLRGHGQHQHCRDRAAPTLDLGGASGSSQLGGLTLGAGGTSRPKRRRVFQRDVLTGPVSAMPSGRALPWPTAAGFAPAWSCGRYLRGHRRYPDPAGGDHWLGLEHGSP